MYLPSQFKSTGTKARIQTGLINVEANTQSCIRFSYHMYGIQMGTLSMRVKSPNGSVIIERVISGRLFIRVFHYMLFNLLGRYSLCCVVFHITIFVLLSHIVFWVSIGFKSYFELEIFHTHSWLDCRLTFKLK